MQEIVFCGFDPQSRKKKYFLNFLFCYKDRKYQSSVLCAKQVHYSPLRKMNERTKIEIEKVKYFYQFYSSSF